MLDAKLTPAQHATGHLVRRTLEESAYWVAVVHARWLEDDVRGHTSGADAGPRSCRRSSGPPSPTAP